MGYSGGNFASSVGIRANSPARAPSRALCRALVFFVGANGTMDVNSSSSVNEASADLINAKPLFRGDVAINARANAPSNSDVASGSGGSKSASVIPVSDIAAGFGRTSYRGVKEHG